MSEDWKTMHTLLERAKNPKDQKAWTDFTQYYEKFIRVVILKMGISPSDADDLVQ